MAKAREDAHTGVIAFVRDRYEVDTLNPLPELAQPRAIRTTRAAGSSPWSASLAWRRGWTCWGRCPGSIACRSWCRSTGAPTLGRPARGSASWSYCSNRPPPGFSGCPRTASHPGRRKISRATWWCLCCPCWRSWRPARSLSGRCGPTASSSRDRRPHGDSGGMRQHARGGRL